MSSRLLQESKSGKQAVREVRKHNDHRRDHMVTLITVCGNGIRCHLHVSGRVSIVIPMVISHLKAGLVGTSRHKCCCIPIYIEDILTRCPPGTVGSNCDVGGNRWR